MAYFMAYLVALLSWLYQFYPLQSFSMCIPSPSGYFLVEGWFHQELISFLMRTMRSTEREEAEVMDGWVGCVFAVSWFEDVWSTMYTQDKWHHWVDSLLSWSLVLAPGALKRTRPVLLSQRGFSPNQQLGNPPNQLETPWAVLWMVNETCRWEGEKLIYFSHSLNVWYLPIDYALEIIRIYLLILNIFKIFPNMSICIVSFAPNKRWWSSDPSWLSITCWTVCFICLMLYCENLWKSMIYVYIYIIIIYNYII